MPIAKTPTKLKQRWRIDRSALADIMMASVVAVIALMLRVYGLQWGLPNPEHLHSYHPDEITVIAPTLGMNIFRGEMNPHFFNYGSLFLYAVYFARLFAEGYGWLDFGVTNPNAWIQEFAKLHLLARWLSVFCGVATVLLVFAWAKRACGRGAAVIAALLLAAFPMHVQHSHFATVDVPLTLLTTLTLFLLTFADGKNRPMLLAAFVAGLATAVKYSVAPALWLTIALLWTWRVQWGERLKRLSLLTIVMAIGFLLGCPYALLAFDEFWRDFYWETFVHSRIGHGLIFVNTGNGYWFHLSVNLPAAVGLPAIALTLVSFGTWVARWVMGKTKNAHTLTPLHICTLLFAVFYFLPLGFAQIRFARYLIPLLPLLALWGGAVWVNNRSPLRWLVRSLVIASVAYTLLCGISITHLFAPPDPRDEAARWIKQFVTRHLPLATRPIIAMHELPWFGTPPICPFNGGKKTESQFYAWQLTSPIEIVLVGYDLDELQKSKAHLFVANDFEYGDRLRLGLDDAERMYRWLHSHSRRVLVFRKEPTLPFWGKPFRWFVKPLPHDMRYVNPVEQVFVLRE